MKTRVWLGLAALALSSVSVVSAQDALRVIATTTIIQDVAQNVAGDMFTVESLLPDGADTHAYQPTTDDAVSLAEADLILSNGIGYEEFLGGLIENANATAPNVEVNLGVTILPLGVEHDSDHEGEADEATEALDEEHESGEPLGIYGDIECEAHDDHEDESESVEADEATEADEHGACDPHTWMNPQNVMIWVENITAAFSELDPDNAETFRANADAYLESLSALDAELEALVETLTEESRILVTNHEFMGYFADHYHFEVVGTVLPGGSSVSETDPQAMADLIMLIQQEGVPAIFVETTATSDVAAAVAEGAGVALIDTLYSESLGSAESAASTYLDFMRFNTQTIVSALGG
jgi:zinc/manganese transport system substrate-binding protein